MSDPIGAGWSMLIGALVLIACGRDPAVVDLNPIGSGSGGSAGARAAPCTTNTQCMLPLPYCVGGRCVQCQTDTNCSGVSEGLHCNLAVHTCVECLASSDCAVGNVCDSVVNRCTLACASDTDCSSDMTHCETTRHMCVECLNDQQCASDRPYCNALTDRCVECLADGNCASGQVCGPSMECTGG